MNIKPFLESLLQKFSFLTPGLANKLSNQLIKDRLFCNLRYLMASGLDLQVVYDIGARHGEWSKTLVKFFPKFTPYLFEANDGCTPLLDDAGFPYFISILSNEIRYAKFYNNNSTGNSLYRENTDAFSNCSPSYIKTNTLHNLVDSLNIPYPDFIKLDTQGSELDVLSGANDIVSDAKIILMEIPIVEYNSGAPNFSEYINFMHDLNFIPFDYCEAHRARDVLLQFDILFINKFVLKELNPSAFSFYKFISD